MWLKGLQQSCLVAATEAEGCLQLEALSCITVSKDVVSSISVK